MADLTLKSQLLAFNIVVASEKLLDAMNDFNALVAEYQASGVTFTDAEFQSQFYNPLTGQQTNLSHLDATSILAAGTQFAALLAWAQANGVMTALNKVRR